MSAGRRNSTTECCPRGLALLLLITSTPAWASSYPGGLLGVVALVLALPGLLIVFLLALGLRASGLCTYAGVRYLFLGLVGLTWLALVLWPLVLGDDLSALVLAVGAGVLGARATGPVWRPCVAAPEPAPQDLPPVAPPLRAVQAAIPAVPALQQAAPVPTPVPPAKPKVAIALPLLCLATYWIVSALIPLLLGARFWLGEERLPLAMLPTWLLTWLVFDGPRLVGAAALLQQTERAQVWLTAAVLLSAMGLVLNWIQDAPVGTLALALMLWALDLLAWRFGRRQGGHRAKRLPTHER